MKTLKPQRFGEDFLETSQRMGLGYRDLRKLRKLDDADREVIIEGEAVKAEDRESLIDLIEEMSAKHRKQKDALETENKELKADKDALETILQKKDEKVNQLDTQVTKLTSPAEIQRRAESEPQELEKAALETLGTESILFLTAFNRYINALGGVMDIAENKDLPQLFERVDESIVAVCQRYAQYVQRLGTEVSFEEILNPSWIFPETADTDTSGQ
jgi:seryl-tRNA synthetase